jgi:predicted RecB family nuclease
VGPRITDGVLEGYLNCKLKGYLRLKGETGPRSDFETLMTGLRDKLRGEAYEKMAARPHGSEVLRGVEIDAKTLKRGASLILDATMEDDIWSLHFDGLMRVEGPSRLGGFHYAPILVVEGEKVRRDQKRLLETLGLVIGDLQAKQPAYGIVVRGRGLKVGRVRLSPGSRLPRRTLEEAKRLAAAESPPKLMLNDHCQVCEYRQRCHLQAVKEDNLSLLRGIGEKEIKNHARRGIFTVTQLAHTFRPRRKGRRVERKVYHRYHALSALAIRDGRIYVFGTPQVPAGPVAVYLDVEGKPDEGFVYLIGLLVVRGGQEAHHSFWADSPDQERIIFERFLDEVERLDDFTMYCYGGYERAFITRMRKTTDRKGLVDRVLASLVNVLSQVYTHFYFPTYSNGLKDVGRCLGFSWSDDEASGVQSIAWRMRWEATRDEQWRQRLTTYNSEDCLALRKVTELVRSVSVDDPPGTGLPSAGADGPPIAWVHEIDRLANDRKWGPNRFVHPEFEFINGCSYFDYQRERVFVRTSSVLRRRKARGHGSQHNRSLRKSKDYVILSTNCESCGSGDVELVYSGEKLVKGTRVKRAFDLVITPGGVRRKVIECRSPVHRCRACGEHFVPRSYRNLDKNFHNLKSWAINLHVAYRHSFMTLEELFRSTFNLKVFTTELIAFKSMMAAAYGAAYRRLLDNILAGRVLLADETEVKLKTGKGFVWVFASLEEVVYMYRPTREGGFLREYLKDFHGVLVSDFYSAYDSMECPQQKCLIHLIRDINQDLLNNPFDEELRSITRPFGTLLRSIVSTVDQHGLKRRHLKRHEKEVASFFDRLGEQSCTSDAAEALRGRLLKGREKLFTFLDHDGVPWNNAIAENAIKRFAYYREDTVGIMTEAGLGDYLVLLSLFQTCRNRGVSFLKFLLSREPDVDSFCEGRRPKRRPPVIEVYPDGYIPPHFAKLRGRAKGDDAPTAPVDVQEGTDGQGSEDRPPRADPEPPHR